MTARTVDTLTILAGPVAASVREISLPALLHPAAASSAIAATLTNTDCEVLGLAMKLRLSFCYTARFRNLFQTVQNQIHELLRY